MTLCVLYAIFKLSYACFISNMFVEVNRNAVWPDKQAKCTSFGALGLKKLCFVFYRFEKRNVKEASESKREKELLSPVSLAPPVLTCKHIYMYIWLKLNLCFQNLYSAKRRRKWKML